MSKELFRCVRTVELVGPKAWVDATLARSVTGSMEVGNGSTVREIRREVGPLAATPDSAFDDRHMRQVQVGNWCKEAFGHDHATDLPQRGVRFLEEAIELAQAVGVTQQMAHALVDYIFNRAVGEVDQEIGGVSVTLLALCAARGTYAEDAERAEINRVLSIPIEHFKARNEVKNAAGFNVVQS